MGSGFTTKQVPIYMRQAAPPPPPPAPAPPPPPPVPAAPPTPAANPYTPQISQIQNQLDSAKEVAAPTAPNIDEITAATEKRYQDMIKEMQIGTANVLKTLTDQFDLTIGGVKNQYGQQMGGLQSEIAGLRGQMQAEADQYRANLANLTAQQEAFQAKQAAGQRAFQENQARATAKPTLQIQPATTEATTGGTSRFKRRKQLDETMMIGGNSTLNVPTTSVLNV
jgi:hypothetical protein